ncbi:MAG: extracellular solute-binding protein [Epulopiscium sp.]|nr:extracellular solute-binding protein [Candidatus Epulonipiscium sp.]
MKKTRVIGLLLVMALATSLSAGCGQKKEANKQTDVTKTNTTGETLEPITFTMFSKDVNQNYENYESPVAKEIQKRTGVTLKMEYPVGDLDEKIGLMIASNDYPDLVYSGQEAKFIGAGAFLKLDDLIEEHGPNIKAIYGDYLKRLRYSAEDPSIYFFGSMGIDAERYTPNMAFAIQHAVVKEAGYPELKTLEQAEKVIQDYIDKYPTINDQPTIGLSLTADDWRWQCSLGNMAAFVAGLPDDGNWYVNPDTYEATYRFTLDNHKEYYRWLNHMNDIGLLDPDALTQKYDQYAAKISSGRVLALNDQLWEYNEPELALRTAGMDERQYGEYPVQLDETYTCADYADYGYSVSYGIGISKNCKDPVRAVQFIDWMCTDEAQILNNWGIEGVHYTIENGKRVRSEEEIYARNTDREYSRRTGIGVYGYPFPQRGDGLLDPTGQTYTIRDDEEIVNSYSEIEKEVLNAYGARIWKDLYPTKDEVPKQVWGQAWGIPIPQDGDLAVIVQKCLDATQAGLPKVVLASPEQFDASWDDLQQQLKDVGVERANVEFTKLVEARMDLWK